jgi:O-antigen ligase
MDCGETGSPGKTVSALTIFLLGAFIFSSTFSIAATQTSLALGLFAWAVLMTSNRTVRPGRTPIDIPILVFVLATLVSIVFSQNRSGSFRFLKNYLLLSSIYFTGAIAISRRIRAGLFWTLLVSGTGSAVYGIAVFLLDKGEGTLGRTPGSFSTAMTYGGIMMMLFSLFLAMAVAGKINIRLRIASAVATAATALALFLSFTRGSWVAALISCMTILAVLRKRWIVPAIIVVIVAVLVLPGPYRERVTSIWDPEYRTNVQRLNMLKGGLSILKEYPVFGTGPTDLGEIYSRHMPPEAKYVHGHMHNNFLHVAVTLGILGLLAFIYMLFSFFRLIVMRMRRESDPAAHAWSAGSLGALTGFVVNGFFEWNFGDAEVLTLMLIIIGSNIFFGSSTSGKERS